MKHASAILFTALTGAIAISIVGCSSEASEGASSTVEASTSVVESSTTLEATSTTEVVVVETTTPPTTSAPTTTTPPVVNPSIVTLPPVIAPPSACPTGVSGEQFEVVITDFGLEVDGEDAPDCFFIRASQGITVINNASGDADVWLGDGTVEVLTGEQWSTEAIGGVFGVGQELTLYVEQLAAFPIDLTVVAG